MTAATLETTEDQDAQPAQDPLWYKDAVIYQLHLKSFFDANNDGVGDFPGLIQKLDYIADLGVTAIWLLPFYPSPRRDDGYDIAAYCDVHSDYGRLEDAATFIAAAHARGLKVITELVINHTSDQHPWFQAARRAPPGSPERDFYVWSDTDKKWPETRIIFLDTETSNWSWDPVAGAYYWHRFYGHQPDLNFDNPKVLEEVLGVMRFWLDAGVDGLRLDAIPYLVERDGTNNENLPETHVILKRIRAALDAGYENKMLLAEANQWPEDTQTYFGDGDECHMAFHFPLMPRMYMAIAQEDRFPITDIMRQTPQIPASCQWAIFLRNHDELTLEMVTDEERDYLWNTYAADRRARINLGIRRRLAPLMERDRRRIELMNSLLLTMPGTPAIYYGDEIGMGDNIHLGDRDGVRTPMQWSQDRNGGFSRADPAELVLPPVQDALYGFMTVNVEAQTRDPHSLLNWLKRMLAVRGRHQVFGRGTQRFLRPRNRKILVYLREQEGAAAILCVANLSRTAQAVELELGEFQGRTPVELSGNTPFPPIGQLSYLVTLPPYGFYWFELCENTPPPSWTTAASLADDIEQTTIVLRGGVGDLLNANVLHVLEREVLPTYIPARRWFQSKNGALQALKVETGAALPGGEAVLLEVAASSSRGESVYTLPLAVAWDGAPTGPYAPSLALSRVRTGRRIGRLTDGFATPEFIKGVIRGFAEDAAVAVDDGWLRFVREPGADFSEEGAIEWIGAEQSNSTAIIDQRLVLKLLRRVVDGVHPEAEMSRALTAKGFGATPAFLGEVVRESADGVRRTLMVVQACVHNRGDGWSFTKDYLKRAMEEPAATLLDYEAFARGFGRRLAEMHAILASPDDNPDFAPTRIDKEGAEALGEAVADQVRAALEVLEDLSFDAQRDAALKETVLERGGDLETAARALGRQAEGALYTRIHGDLHLGQVLMTAGDVAIIDFEGEPLRPLAARRAKASPMRDVAGVLRSFDYAAAVALKDAPAETREQKPQTAEMLASFRARAPEAFLEGYAEGGGVISAPLLELFLLEKAAYELAYEAANRPDWADVPLVGLAERLAPPKNAIVTEP
jgi:maltose alpha-D-glucosyltransferase/alpha-amylase